MSTGNTWPDTISYYSDWGTLSGRLYMYFGNFRTSSSASNSATYCDINEWINLFHRAESFWSSCYVPRPINNFETLRGNWQFVTSLTTGQLPCHRPDEVSSHSKRLRAERPGVRIPVRARDCPLLYNVHTDSGAHTHTAHTHTHIDSYLMCTGGASPGGTTAEKWSWPLPPSRAVVRNECSYVFIPPLCLHGVHRNTIRSTFC